MSERNTGEGGVPIAHAPETGDGQEVSMGELLGMLELRRDRLEERIKSQQGYRDTCNAKIKEARAELVKVERFLKAAKPRGAK